MEPNPSLFGRAIQFLYAIGLPPMRILKGLVIFLIIGLLFGGLFFLDIPNPFKSSNTRGPEDDEPVEFVSQPDLSPSALSLDEEIDEIYYFRQNENINYVVAIGEIEAEQAKITELLQRMDLSEEHIQKLQFTALRHEQTRLRRSFRARALGRAEVTELRNFAEQFVGGADAKLDEFAKYTICDAENLLLQVEPSEENAKVLSQALLDCKSSFLANNQRAETLYRQLLQTRQLHPGNPHLDKAIDNLGELLTSSEDETVANLAVEIGEFSRFSSFEIESLESRIRLRVDGSLQDLDNALRALGEAPETDIETWKKLIGAYESSISNGQTKILETGWRIINELVNELPDTDSKKAPLKKLLENQLKRSKKAGSKIALEGLETVRGLPFTNLDDAHLIVFADREPKSSEALKELNSRQREGLSLKRPIIAFKDDYTAEDHEALEKVKAYQLSSFETAQKLTDMLSIDTFPYIVLLDREGRVVDLNLSTEQAVRRINALE